MIYLLSSIILASCAYADPDPFKIYNININEPFGTITRQYALSVPESYDDSLPIPLLMYFHGSYDEWPATSSNYWKLGEKHRFITVYPRGYSDYGGKVTDTDITWNVGINDNGVEAANDICFPGAEPVCFDSCKPNCSLCAQYTCVDDINFVK